MYGRCAAAPAASSPSGSSSSSSLAMSCPGRLRARHSGDIPAQRGTRKEEKKEERREKERREKEKENRCYKYCQEQAAGPRAASSAAGEDRALTQEMTSCGRAQRAWIRSRPPRRMPGLGTWPWRPGGVSSRHRQHGWLPKGAAGSLHAV